MNPEFKESSLGEAPHGIHSRIMAKQMNIKCNALTGAPHAASVVWKTTAIGEMIVMCDIQIFWVKYIIS